MSSTTRSKRRCPSCGSSNPAHATSCDMCGYVFGAPEDARASRQPSSFQPAQVVAPAQPAQSQAPSRPIATPASSEAHPEAFASVRPEPSSATPDETLSAQDVPIAPSVAAEEGRMPSEPAATISQDGQVAPEVPHGSKSRRLSYGAPSSAQGEFKAKPQATTYAGRPRAAPSRGQTVPSSLSTAKGKRPSAILAPPRSRGPAKIVIILAVVLGAAALLAIALATLEVIRDSSGRPAAATPRSIAEPTVDVLPMVATATDAPPTPVMAIQPPSEAPSPTATMTEPPPTSAPQPTDAPPMPTETPEPQPTDTPAARQVTYTVQQGDTCWAIATRFNISLDDLIRRNNLTAECLIRPGQELSVAP